MMNHNKTLDSNYRTKTATQLQESIRFRGRVATLGDAITFDWSASGFEFEFEGSGEITANITANPFANLLMVVDGNQTRITVDGDSNILLASNLKAGVHIIKVYKLSEAAGSLAQLNSLSFLEDSVLRKTDECALNIEFLGDSITCGNQIAFEVEDGFLAYASLTAQAMNADWNTIAVSGRGLTAGWNSENGWALSREHEIKDLYQYTSWFRNQEDRWDFTRFVPDVVVANLGNNDLGPDTGVTIEEFCKEMKEFSNLVRKNYPKAYIVWCYGLYINRNYIEEYQRAVEEIARDDSKVSFLLFPQMIGGHDCHPDYEEHKATAELLKAHIEKVYNYFT